MSILVIGSFVVDLTSRSKSLPVPGQTLIASMFKMGPGGKGSNQAVAAHRAGADVTLVTKLGKDVFSQVALDFYRNEGISTEHILHASSTYTGAALIMVDEVTAQNMIVVAPGACGRLTLDDIDRCRPLIERSNILLLQLEINFDALYRVINIAHQSGVKIVLNPAPAASLPDDILSLIDIVTPNEIEAEALTGIKIKNKDDARRAAEMFLNKGVKQVVITLGSIGAYAFDGKQDELIPRLNVEAIDTTGAGDAFNGGFVTALDEGMDLFTALRFGNAAGALSVTRLGTAPSMPTRKEIDKMYRSNYRI